MNILIVNDDGIKAAGIQKLAEALVSLPGAEIYVFAPDGQRSGAGHSISLGGQVRVQQVEFSGAGLAFAVNGTPADCVAVGDRILKDRGIKTDMVISGINHGSNVGTDTVYSGTVGAAVEGAIQGYPSVAVSVDSLRPEHFEFACELVLDAIAKTGGSWNREIILNINVPDLPAEEIKGVRYTRLGEREYTNDVQLKESCGNVATYIYAGEAVVYERDDEDIDVLAIQNGYASVSPLTIDMTNESAKAEIEKWRIGK